MPANERRPKKTNARAKRAAPRQRTAPQSPRPANSAPEPPPAGAEDEVVSPRAELAALAPEAWVRVRYDGQGLAAHRLAGVFAPGTETTLRWGEVQNLLDRPGFVIRPGSARFRRAG